LRKESFEYGVKGWSLYCDLRVLGFVICRHVWSCVFTSTSGI